MVAEYNLEFPIVSKILVFSTTFDQLCVQSSLSIFAQKYLSKCENKYLCIYKNCFGGKILIDDCALTPMDEPNHTFRKQQINNWYMTKLETLVVL